MPGTEQCLNSGSEIRGLVRFLDELQRAERSAFCHNLRRDPRRHDERPRARMSASHFLQERS